MHDSQILALYFARDESAIRETSAKYGAYCTTVAENILQSREDCEECVSDTWLKAWNAIPPQKPTVLKLFLARITRNLAISRCRILSAQKRGGGTAALALDELSECLSSGEDVQNTLEAEDLRAAIQQFLKKLTPRDRDVFLRRYFYLRTTQDIARDYDLTEQNVLVILSRARKKLKSHLQKGGYAL